VYAIPMLKEEDYLNDILCGDALEKLKKIPSESIELIVTSPPYNIRNTTGGGFKRKGGASKWKNAALIDGYSDHSDDLPHEEYVEWQRACLSEMWRIIPDNGAIFYNHKWRVQNGLMQDRRDIIEGFPLRQIIIWQRAGGINFNDGYFLPTYEVIYMICKPDFMLAPKGNLHGDVWKITQDNDNEHPAPFPIEIPDRIIGATTAKTVLDPFMGSGTTAVAAIKNGRNFVGIEISPIYIAMAAKRIHEIENSEDFLQF